MHKYEKGTQLGTGAYGVSIYKGKGTLLLKDVNLTPSISKYSDCLQR